MPEKRTKQLSKGSRSESVGDYFHGQPQSPQPMGLVFRYSESARLQRRHPEPRHDDRVCVELKGLEHAADLRADPQELRVAQTPHLRVLFSDKKSKYTRI
jgi:hypothetical protein